MRPSRFIILFTAMVIWTACIDTVLGQTKPRQRWKVKTGDMVLDMDMDSDTNVLCGLGTYEPEVGGVALFSPSGKLLWKKDLKYNIYSVSISEDGKKLAVGSWDGLVYCFDQRGEILWKHKFKKIVFSIAFDRSGTHLAAASDNKIYLLKGKDVIWDYKTKGLIRDIAISGSGDLIVAGDESGSVYLINESGELIWKKSFPDIVYCVGISREKGYIAVGGKDRKLSLFNRSGKIQWEYLAGDTILKVSLSRSGQYVSCKSMDKYIYLLNHEGKVVWKYLTADTISGFSLSDDAKYMSAGGWYQYLVLLDNTDVLNLIGSQRSLGRAEKLLEAGSYEQAIKELKSAVDLNPGNKKAKALLEKAKNARNKIILDKKVSESIKKAEGYLSKGLINDAVTVFKEILDIDPSEKTAKEHLARLISSSVREAEELLRAGKYNEAITEYEKVLFIDPGHWDSRVKIRECRQVMELEELLAPGMEIFGRGDYDAAGEYFNRIFALDKSIPAVSEKMKIIVSLYANTAEEHISERDYGSAIDIVKKGIVVAGTDPVLKSTLWRARKRLVMDKFRLPIMGLVLIFVIFFNFIVYHRHRNYRLLKTAQENVERGDYETAASISKKIISTRFGIHVLEELIFRKKRKEAMYILAQCHLKLHRLDPEAEDVYRKVLSYDPDREQAIALQAQICLMKDYLDERARLIYERAVQVFPEHEIYLEKLIRIYKNEGIYDQRTALAYEKKGLWEEAGKAYEYMENYEKAEKMYEKAGSLERIAELHYYRGDPITAAQMYQKINRRDVAMELYIKKQAYGPAENSINEYLLKNDKDIKILDEMVYLMISKGDYTKAISILKRIIDIDRLGFEPWKRMGLLLTNNGRIKDAIETYERISLLFSEEHEFPLRLLNLYSKIGNNERFLILAERLRTRGRLAIGKMRLLAQFYEKNKRYREAEEVYSEIMDIITKNAIFEDILRSG